MDGEKLTKDVIKLLKEGSFMAVRLLLKDELIENCNTQLLLCGTGIKAKQLKNSYRRLKKRNNDNTHLDKIRNKNK